MINMARLLGMPQVDDVEAELPPEIAAAAQARMERGGPPPGGGDLGVSDVINPRSKTSAGRQLWAFLAAGGGASDADLQRIRDPDASQRAADLRVKQAKKLFPGDAMAQMLWVQGDDDFRKTLGKRYEDTVVKDDEDLVRNGSRVYRNAKTSQGVEGGYGYTIEDGQTSWGAQRGPSHAETETRRSNRADEAIAAQRADQDGAKIDADADNDEARTVVQRILRKAGKGEPLSEQEQQIFDAEMTRMKRGGDEMFPGMAAPTGGGAPLAPGPSTPAGGLVDPAGLDAGIRKPLRRPAAQQASPAAKAEAARAAGIPEGGTFRSRGSDGKLHRYRKLPGGGYQDLGVIEG
jgi:hypothetical protein